MMWPNGSGYKKNKIGPSTEPCGTQRDVTAGEELKLAKVLTF